MIRRTMLLSRDNQDSIIDKNHLKSIFNKSVLGQALYALETSWQGMAMGLV